MIQEEGPGSDETVLLESVAVPSPEVVGHESEEPNETNRNGECSTQHHQVTDDHLDSNNSHTVETAEGVSEQNGSATCLVNTSDDSLVHHATVLSEHSSNQTEPDAGEQGVDAKSEVPSSVTEAEQESESRDDVYSSVVSPLRSNREPSPLNTLSLEQEMRGVDGSPEVDDRNLERFSEILLDSDHSQSDEVEGGEESVPPDAEAKNKPKKRVRFADEVEQKESSKNTASYLTLHVHVLGT